MYSGSNPTTDYIFAGVLLLGLLGWLLRRWLNNRSSQASVDYTDLSLIMTLYTMGVDVQKISEGQIADYHYLLLVTTPIVVPPVADYQIGGPTAPFRAPLPQGVLRAPVGQAILSVDLPVKSRVHFAGFNLQDPMLTGLLGNTSLDNQLTRVQLEGDFPDYFRLYCDKGKEVELRQVLDPIRMEFLVDFCQKFNWELIESSLYFVQSDTSKGAGGEVMIRAAEEFVQKILPTLRNMAFEPSDHASA